MAEADHNLSEADAEQPTENPESEQREGQVEEASGGSGSGEKKWPGWPGESVFRMLVPAQKVGGIIGRKGEFIKKIVEETRARIKILDGPPGTSERAVSFAQSFHGIIFSKFVNVGLPHLGLFPCPWFSSYKPHPRTYQAQHNNIAVFF